MGNDGSREVEVQCASAVAPLTSEEKAAVSFAYVRVMAFHMWVSTDNFTHDEICRAMLRAARMLKLSLTEVQLSAAVSAAADVYATFLLEEQPDSEEQSP